MLKPRFKKEKNDYIFTNLKIKCRLAVLMVMLFVASVTTVYAVPQTSSAVFYNGSNNASVFSTSSTAKSDIYENGYLYAENNDADALLKSSLYKGVRSTVGPLKKVNLISNGFNVSYNTTAETYKDFFSENGIIISNDDIVSVNIDDVIPAESQIKVTRVKRSIVEVPEGIPYTSSQVSDANLYAGESAVAQYGVPGTKNIQYEVVYVDGELISTTYVGEYVVNQPVNEIISVGTKSKEPEVLTATVGSHTFNYKTVLTCQATAYDLSFASTGKHPGSPGYGITASGTQAKVGTVAVDPKVIPLGTKMYIVSTDGNVVYGYCTAEDTGGAIKGNKVDLFYNTTSECLQFGRRSVYVYIL